MDGSALVAQLSSETYTVRSELQDLPLASASGRALRSLRTGNRLWNRWPDRLKKIRDQFGPESLFIECSPAAGLDFHYPALRFAALWGTPTHSVPTTIPKAQIPPASECSGCRMLRLDLQPISSDCRCRSASTHPIPFRWVLEAQKNGAKVIVADTRFYKDYVQS